MPEILGNTTHAKHAMGINLSLLKGGTITQTIIGAIITGLVIASTIATIILVSFGAGYSSPVANPDTATTFKRVDVTLDVLANDIDPRGGNLTLTQIVVSPSHGTVKIVSNSKIIYQSIGAFSGVDTFSYEVTNSFMTANATVTVNVLNRAPEAVPITKTVSKNVKNSLVDIFNYVGDNDEKISDPDSDIVYAVSYSGRKILSGNENSFGSLTVDPYNGFVYTPVDGFNGVEQFNYTISDGNDTATSTVTLSIANDAPVAVDNVYNVPKYGSLALDVLANDYDINGDDFNITSGAGTSYGAIMVEKKLITYITSSTLTKKYSDSFEYTISDGNLEASAIVIVNVYNTAPTVFSKTVTVAKSSLNNLITVDYNDVDRKDLITLNRITPALSSLSPTASLLITTTYENVFFECCEWINVETNNYTISFTPVANTVYTQAFTVTMTDSEAEGTGVITVIVQNTPPVAVDDSAECNKNQQVLINVVANDYDENSGDTALIQLTTEGWTSATTNGGSVSVYNATHVLYTAPKNFLGDDVATYVITDQSKDASGKSDSTSFAKGTITITVVNNPPTPADDTITISKGVTSSLNVLENDSDPNDGASSVYTINSVTASSIKNILATIVKNSGAKDTLSYTATNEEYTDKLTYDVTDQDGMTSTYKATVTLNVVNDAPVATDDSYSTKWNRSVECSVKDNDSDLNGDLAKSTISLSTNPSNGVALVVGDKIVYTPANGFVGTDSFKYKLNDGSSLNADSNSATVTITVTNAAPVTVADSATTHWNNPNGILISPLSNDNDPDGDALVVSSASADSSVGVATVSDSQTVKFVPNAVSATTGTKQVTYYASDYNKQTVGTINVQVTNTKPVANADSYTLHWAASATQLTVLDNDSDADSDSLTVGSVSGSTAAVKSGSSVLYTPKKDGVTDTFQYTATDSVTASDAATVTVQFTNNAQPSVSDSSTSIHWRIFADQLNQQDFPVLSSNTDTDGDSITLSVTAAATGLSGASCSKTTDTIPKVRVSAPTKTLGTASCSYSVSDGLASSSAKASLTITNNAPTCTDITVSFNPKYISSGQSFSIASAVADADPNDISYLVPGSAIIVGSTYSGDSFQVSGSNLLFKPTATVGDRNYAYTVTDGVSTSSQCNIKIVVSSVSSSDYDQSFDLHWGVTSSKLDILAKLTTSTIVRLGSTAASGTASISGGNLYFTPLRKIYIDTFTVIVADAGNVESTVKVTVSTFNNVPTASLSTQTINWGTSKTIDLLVNYADSDYTNGLESKGTVSNIDKTSLSTKGTLSALSGSSVTYYAPANYVGSDSFKVTATDGLATVTFTVTFNMINTAPVTNTKSFNVHWATHKTGYSMNLATGVTDAEGNTLTYAVTSSSISPSTAGTVVLGTSPNAVATGPSTPYLGKFTFTYSASDSIATTPGTVQVTVYNNMSTPIADSKDVHWRATGVTLSPLLKFASTLKDVDGDSLTLVSASAQKGTVSTGSTTLSYSAPANAIGVDVVTYKFTDGAESLQNAATIVNINLFNTPPRAIDKTASGKWSSVIPVDLTSSCVDDDSLDTASFNGAVSSIVGGTTSVSGKVVSYTPTTSLTYSGSNGAYTATGSFKFQCTDGLSTATNPGTVTVTVTNNAPTGTGKTTSVNRDYTKTTYDFTWAEIATVSDADGDSISYINFASSDSSITVSNIGTGIRLTTSNKLVLGEKSITFKLNDGLHDSVSSLTFKVTFVNSAPVCAANSVTLKKKGSIDLSTLFSATDSNNDPFTYALASSISTDFGTTSGTVFTASSTRSGSTSVTYTATDSQSTSTACTISVTISNSAPVADDISYQVVPVSGSYVHSYTYVATDADSDTLTYAATSNDCVSQSLATSVVISSTGAVTFTRKSTAVSGSCKLYVTVSDNNQLTNAQDTAVITFIISSTSPAAKDDRFEINQGQTIRIYASQILANDVDEFNSVSTLTLTSISCPDSTYCHNTPRQVTYNNLPAVELDSDSSTCQADKFRYTMTTGMGATRSADVYVEFKNCYCAAKIDFVFLLDSSKSIGSSNFDLMRDLAKRITGRMKIASDAIKVSIVKFHNNDTLALPLSTDGTLINSTLSTMDYEAGSTAQIPGLRAAVDALRPSNGGRADADKVIYILTDGLANVPCSCTSCRNEWQAKPSVFYNSIQVNILGKYTGTSTLNSKLDGLCAYQYTDTSVLNGQTCSYCSSKNTAYCLPCADAVPIAKKINSWKRNSAGVVPADLDNPYNGNNNVQWKIVAMAVGDAMSNVWGARQIQGMNYDSTRALTVSWTDLSSTMSEIVDQSCNQVTTTAA